MADDKALEIQANVTIDGSDVHPTQIKLINAVNSLAQAQVTYIHKSSDADKQATDITASEIFEAMAQRQMKSFNDTPEAQGVRIMLTDAYEDSSILFVGNTSAPSYSFSSDSVELTEDVQPDYAALNCLDLSIYDNAQMDIDAIADTDYPSNIAEFIKKVFENIIKNGLEKIETSETTGDITKECSKKQHEINEKVKQFAIQLFDNSKDTIGWDGVKDQLGAGSIHLLKERIYAALRSNAGGFFNNLMHLAEEFQCVYVPELDNIGKLVNKKKLFEDAETLKLHSVSLSARAGSIGMYPVRAVAVKCVGTVTADMDLIQDNNDYGIIYPKELKPGGSILQVLGPQWLPSEHFTEAEVKPVKDGNDEQKIQQNTLEPKSAQNVQVVIDANSQQVEKNEKVVEQWAETVYYWQALGQAYAILNTELNLKAKVGKRYTVEGDSGVLFSGILNAVDHTITTGYQSCTAWSNLQFSHVIMGSASIPGIE